MSALPESARENLLDCLDSLQTVPEVFELLDDETQQKLQREFVSEYLDDDDRESAVFCLIDEHDGKDRHDNRARLDRQWRDFLDNRDLRGTYGEQLERNYLAQHEDEEPERWDGLG